MNRPSILALLSIGAWPCLASGGAADVVERGKAATALVEVFEPGGGSMGSAFCIDKGGLFVTNAHVVAGVKPDEDRVRVIVDIGLPTQRVLKARVYRTDDVLDLAMLTVKADAGLAPLLLGADAEIALTAEVMTFGFPFGKLPAVARDAFPDITVITSRVTALRMAEGRLKVVQFDGQINPGNSGGPVLDGRGRVFGVAVRTVPGAAINEAVPVGELADFLAAPGLVFDPPRLDYEDRSRQVTWKIKVRPARPGGEIPAGVGVSISITSDGEEEPRTVAARPTGGGEFVATFTPVPRDPDRMVAIEAFLEGRRVSLPIKDREVTVGGRKFLAGDLINLNLGPDPSALTARGALVKGAISGLPKIKMKVNDKPTTFDLARSTSIKLRALDARPVRWVAAAVEARGEDGKTLASVGRRTEFSPPMRPRGPAPAPFVIVRPAQVLGDEGRLDIEGILEAWDSPRSAGSSIRPPTAAMGSVPFGDEPPAREDVLEFVGHRNGLWGLALSPDGKQLLTASHDSTARLWDAASGRSLRELGSRDHVKAVAFLPDGARAISVGDDDMVRVWDLRTGRQIREMPGHGHDLSSVAVSADGKIALTGCNDKTARVWDLTNYRQARAPFVHPDEVSRVALLADGKRAVTAAGGDVRVWDLESGRQLVTFHPGPGPLMIAGSPDGKLVVVGADDGSVQTWDPTAGTLVARLGKHGGPINGVAFAADGRRAFSVSEKDRTVRVWDIAKGREIGELRKDGFPGRDVKVSADGRLVAVAGEDGIARTWTLPTPGATIAGKVSPLTITLPGKVSDVAVGGGGRFLLLTLKESRQLAIFDVNAAEVVKTIPLPSANALVAAGARKFVIAFPDEKLIQRWDLGTLARDADAGGPSPIRANLRRICLGSDSDGPILASWIAEASPGQIAFVRFSFLDLDTLKVLRVGPISSGGAFGREASVSESGGSFTLKSFLGEETRIRASAGGGLFAFFGKLMRPSGFQTLRLQGRELAGWEDHQEGGYLAPGADGMAIFSAKLGRLDAQGKPIGKTATNKAGRPEPTFPSIDPTYFLTLPSPEIPSMVFQQRRAGKLVPLPTPELPASVNLAADGSKLIDFRVPDEMPRDWEAPEGSDDLTGEKRIHLIPAARLLITIPSANDRLVLRKLDIPEAAARNDADYLFVTSPTRIEAKAGQALVHQIVARSKKGRVAFTLASGPTGLKVDPAGKVTYPVPEATSGMAEVKAVITVADASGREVFHTLMIRSR